MGTINVFLGGTGKYIASLQEGRSNIYRDGQGATPYVVLDVDPAIVLKGPFSVEDRLYQPGNETAYNLPARIAEWVAAGQTLVNGAVQPGASLMTSAAQSLAPEFAANRAGLWTLRGAGPLALSALQPTQAARNFRQALSAAIVAAAGDDPVRLNIVSSLAGGTGSGTFIHTALLARELAEQNNVPSTVAGIFVSWSAFDYDWGTTAPPDSDDVQNRNRTKGLTGSFAAFRDIKLSSQSSDPRMIPGYRYLPLELNGASERVYFGVRAQGNQNQLSPVFDRVFVYGRREGDRVKSASLFPEVERFLTVLSDPAASQEIINANLLQTGALIPDVGQIEYRRLEMAEQLAAAVAATALRLAGSRQEIDDPETNLLTQAGSVGALGGQTSGGSSVWTYLSTAANAVFASDDLAGAAGRSLDWQELSRLANALAPDTAFSHISRDTARRTSRGSTSTGYLTNDAAEWESYCDDLLADLNRTHETLIQGLAAGAKSVAEDAANEAVEAVKRHVVDRLSGQDRAWSIGRAMGTLKTQIARLERVRGRTALNWREQVRIDDEGEAEDLLKNSDQLEAAKRALRDPRAEGIGRRWYQHWIFAFLLAVPAGVAGFMLGREVDLTDLWAGVAGAMIGAAALLFIRKLQERGGKTLPELRQEAEQRLFDLHLTAVKAAAMDEMWPALHRSFCVPLVGTGAAGDSEETGRLQGILADLDELATALELIAVRLDASTRQFEENVPPSVVETVYPHLVTDAVRDPRFLHLAEGLRNQLVFVGLGPRGQMTELELGMGQPGERGIRCALAERPQSETSEDVWDAAYRAFFVRLLEEGRMTLSANGEQAANPVIPPTLADALSRTRGAGDAGELARLLSSLHGAMKNRAHAGRVVTPIDSPTWERIFIGADNLELFTRALPLCDAATRAAIGGAQPTSMVGNDQGIVWARIWVKNVVDQLQDYQTAAQAYYGQTFQADNRPPPGRVRYHGRDPVFHTLPETAAAAEVEFRQRLVQPLDPRVTVRLHGSDPSMNGPTVMALFYLLRRRGRLAARVQGETITVELMFDQGTPGVPGGALPIATINLALGGGAGDDIGQAARYRFLVMFDAFALFMTYRGEPLVPAAITTLYDGSINANAWYALGPVVIKTLQDSLKREWFDLFNERTAVGGLHDEMIAEANEDAQSTGSDGFQLSWLAAATACINESLRRLRAGG